MTKRNTIPRNPQIKKSRLVPTRRWLMFWCLFIGVGALVGGVCMLIKPDGSILQMQTMLPYFKKLPFADVLFRNYIFPGIALICVNGITNIIAAILLLGHKRSGIVLGAIFGVTLMLWICIQFYMFPANPLSTSYFIFGLIQAVTGFAAWVFDRQESFTIDESRYSNIGTNQKRLVVYFSRLGYVKKAAMDEAERTGAQLCEIKCTEPTQGTSGFWWCGRSALLGKKMAIEKIDIDLGQFKQVTICSAIWVGRLASPVLSFCEQYGDKIRSVDYILLHFNRASYKGSVKEADRLLQQENNDIKSTLNKSICTRWGNNR